MKALFPLGVVSLAYFLSGQPGTGGDSLEVIEAAAPSYPSPPSGGKEGGEVRVLIRVDSKGSVVLAKATSGPAGLREAAEAAALRWRFASRREGADHELVFAFILRSGLVDRGVASIFKPPNRMEMFAADREVITLPPTPPMDDVEREVKKKEGKKRP